MKRLRQLESENAKLKKLVAERDLEIEVMREVARQVWSLMPCRFATSGTGLRSASRRIFTICSSENRLFFMGGFL